MTSVTSIGPIPQIGYGTWQRDGDEARRCVLWALEAGYRHLDTAEGYGNEAFVSKALAESDVARDAIFLTTKVAPDHLGPGQVMAHARARSTVLAPITSTCCSCTGRRSATATRWRTTSGSSPRCRTRG